MPPRGRVLIVDDEINARVALTELLRDEGYVVEAVADGEAALALISQFQPQVVLTDINMPGLDGFQLLRGVRERDPRIAVIVMTAVDGAEALHFAGRKGADYFLTKPIDVAALDAIVSRETARVAGSTPAAEQPAPADTLRSR